ncbi:MAG TPA: hypothetical protein VGR28_00050 [Candidatus Thermoplasmatota archaeon]|jgi:hypothetical protein|nr:hypothetical protein [Candidatus Thermoplasmatota archaeon]
MAAGDVAAALACAAGLVLTVAAFADLPLTGALFGAALCGIVAGLLARTPRTAAAAGLAGGAVGALALLVLHLEGLSLLTGRVAAAAGAGVVVAQAAVLGFLPGASAGLLAALLARRDRSLDVRPSEGPRPRGP